MWHLSIIELSETKNTECKESEYTCNDGQCVQMDQRCDQIPNCKDRSDEKGCQLVVLNEGYNKEVPPFVSFNTTHTGRIIPVKVNVSIELFNVTSIDEVANTIDFKFEIDLQWFDHRHTYNNLNGNRFFLNTLNEADLKRIWLPLIVYWNTDQFQTTKLGWGNERSTSVRIIPRGNFQRYLVFRITLKDMNDSYQILIGVDPKKWLTGGYTKGLKTG